MKEYLKDHQLLLLLKYVLLILLLGNTMYLLVLLLLLRKLKTIKKLGDTKGNMMRKAKID